MTPTLSRPLRKIGVKTEQFQPWVELELLPALREVQQALNYTAVSKATIPTDGTGTVTTIWSSQDIANGTAVMIDASVVAVATAARSAFKVAALFRNTGLVAQEGATATIYAQDVSGIAVTFAVVASHVELRVNDTGVGAFNWVAVISALEVVG